MSRLHRRWHGQWAGALLVGLSSLQVATAQTLETETARTLPKNGIKIGGNYEFQRSSEGRETAVPFLFEYGLTANTELVIEPVGYAAIRPKLKAGRATGAGDTEITLIQRLVGTASSRFAFAVAGEVKIPTAKNPLIGTGKTDYAMYLIGSQRFGRFDGHANIGYTIVGKPLGLAVANIANIAVGWTYDLAGRTKLFGEVLGNTAAGAGAPETSAAPEIAGGELVGTIGIGQMIQKRFFATVGISYDNNGALQIRPGFVLRVH